MGVHGLWELLSPVGHRVSNEHVRHKILAVDISIWLTQFVKAMRDAEGAQVRNAHLLGVFRRCIKLLYLSVRPVLVFDGETPALKRRTLAGRRAMRERNEAKLRRLAERMLVNRMKQHVIADAIRKKGALKAAETVENENAEDVQKHRVKSPKDGRKGRHAVSVVIESDAEDDEDIIEPVYKPEKGNESFPLATEEEVTEIQAIPTCGVGDSHAKNAISGDYRVDKESSHQEEEDAIFAADLADEEEEISRKRDSEPVELPHDPDDIDDKALQDLPATMQSEVFKQIKLRHRAEHRERMMLRKDDPAEFSRTQIEGFLQSTALNRKICNVRNALNNESGAMQRIASDSARQFFLEENEDEVGNDNKKFESDNSSDDLNDDGHESSDGTGTRITGSGGSDILAQIRARRDVGFKRSITRQEYRQKEARESSEKQSGVGWASRVLEGKGGLTLGGRSALGNSTEEKQEETSGDDEEYWEEGIQIHDYVQQNEENLPSVKEDAADDDIEWEDGNDIAGRGGMNANLAFIKNPFSKEWQNKDGGDSAAVCAARFETFGPGLLDLNSKEDSQEEAKSNVTEQRNGLLDIDAEDVDDTRLQSNEIDKRHPQETGNTTEDSARRPARTPDSNINPASAENAVRDKNSGDRTTLVIPRKIEKGSGTSVASDKPDRQRKVQAEGENVIEEYVSEFKSKPLELSTYSILGTPDEHEKCTEKPNKKNLEKSLKSTLERPRNKEFASNLMKSSRGRAVHLAQNEDKIEPAAAKGKQVDRFNLEKGRKKKSEEDEDRDVQNANALSLQNESIGDIKVGVGNQENRLRNKADDEEDCDLQMAITLSLQKEFMDDDPDKGLDEDELDKKFEQNVTEVNEEAEDVSISKVSPAQERPSHKEEVPNQQAAETDPPAELSAKDFSKTDASQVTKDAVSSPQRVVHSEKTFPVSQKPESFQDGKEMGNVVESQRDGGAADVAESRHFEATEMSTERMQELRNELEVEERELQRRKTSHQGAAESVSEEMYGETRDLLKLFGIPYLQAPMEAEAQCAYLNMERVVDGIITEDSDAFLFGAKTVYRHLFSEGQFAEAYEAEDIESKLGLNRDLLIRLAYLLGSDYTVGVRGVGVVNSMEVLEAFPGEKGLEEFREWTKQVTVFDKEPEEEVMTGRSPEAIRRRFCWKHRNMKRNWEIRPEFPNTAIREAYQRPEVDRGTERFRWGRVDFAGLNKFCWEKFGWERERFDAAVGPLKKVLQESRGKQQRTIDEFFKPHRFAKIRSERLQTAVKGMVGEEAAELMATLGPRVVRKRKVAAVTQTALDSDEEEELMAIAEKFEKEEQQQRRRKRKR